MRNWERAFRRASFRGARFWVEDDGPKKGRRVAVHNISGGEDPVTEDAGRITTEFPVTAYVASDLADVEGRVLEAACSAPGPSILIMPMDPAEMVRCLGCTRSRSKNRNGYIGYELTFVIAGGSGLTSAVGLPALRGSFSVGLVEVAASLAGAF